MAAPLIAPLPPDVRMVADARVRLTALDPTTGATVAGVTISAATLQVDTLSDAGALIEPGVPWYTPGAVAP